MLTVPRAPSPRPGSGCGGKGSRDLRSSDRGDLIVTVHVDLPESLNAHQKELLREALGISAAREAAPTQEERPLRSTIVGRPWRGVGGDDRSPSTTSPSGRGRLPTTRAALPLPREPPHLPGRPGGLRLLGARPGNRAPHRGARPRPPRPDPRPGLRVGSGRDRGGPVGAARARGPDRGQPTRRPPGARQPAAQPASGTPRCGSGRAFAPVEGSAST